MHFQPKIAEAFKVSGKYQFSQRNELNQTLLSTPSRKRQGSPLDEQDVNDENIEDTSDKDLHILETTGSDNVKQIKNKMSIKKKSKIIPIQSRRLMDDYMKGLQKKTWAEHGFAAWVFQII